MLKTARGTQAVLDLEDSAPDVLFEHVGDSPVPLWPQIRSQVWTALNKLDYQLEPVAGPEQPRSSAWLGLGRSFLPSRWDARFAKGRSPLCFLMGGTTVHAVGGRERNWLVGDYIDEIAVHASVVQWAPLPSRLGPPAHSATWSLDPLVTRSAGFARLSRRDPEPGVRFIVSEAIRQLDVRLGEEQVAAIVRESVYHERLRPHIDVAVSRILDRLSPSVVLMEDASYGTWAGMIVMMKDRGIVVAEPQHGWIGPTHAAYNFGAAMYREPLRHTLPDELLTFGEYWGQGLRFPGRITCVGKPHLEEIAAVAPLPVASRTSVLVVSSTADPDEMAQFVLSLREKLDRRWTVAFRPHPAERKMLSERYPRLMSVDGIRIDTRGDVYESLREAAVVIGVASTVLFEASAFGCRVFVRDSPLTDYYVGGRFGPTIKNESDLAQVAKHINGSDLSEAPAVGDGGDLWATGSVQRFQTWLQGTLRS